MSSSSMVSDTVIIRELAWKPRWVTIISENSWARSTLDISRALFLMAPVPSSPAMVILAGPELALAEK